MKNLLIFVITAFLSLSIYADDRGTPINGNFLGTFVKETELETCKARVTCVFNKTCHVTLTAKVKDVYDITAKVEAEVKEDTEDKLYIKRKISKSVTWLKIRNKYKETFKAKITLNEDGTYDFSLTKKRHDWFPLPYVGWNNITCDGMTQK